MKARETIRLALIYAISDRECFLESIANTRDAELIRETKEEIAAFRAMYKRRYDSGGTPMERAIANAEAATLDELRAQGHRRPGK